MPERRMSRKKTGTLIVGAAILVIVGIWFRGCFPPNQRSLVQKFHRHKVTFEKIRAMLADDRAKIRGVAFYGCIPADTSISCPPEEVGISDERYAEYLRLLRRGGAGSVIRRTDETCFVMGGSGFASYGWRVAIIHRETPPDNVIPSLREFRHGGLAADRDQAYCPIEDDWYIWIIW